MTDRPDFTSIVQAITQAHKETIEALRRCCQEWKELAVESPSCAPEAAEVDPLESMNESEKKLLGIFSFDPEQSISREEAAKKSNLPASSYVFGLVTSLRKRGYLRRNESGFYRVK